VGTNSRQAGRCCWQAAAGWACCSSYRAHASGVEEEEAAYEGTAAAVARSMEHSDHVIDPIGYSRLTLQEKGNRPAVLSEDPARQVAHTAHVPGGLATNANSSNGDSHVTTPVVGRTCTYRRRSTCRHAASVHAR
jgi:hypothetical protein